MLRIHYRRRAETIHCLPMRESADQAEYNYYDQHGGYNRTDKIKQFKFSLLGLA